MQLGYPYPKRVKLLDELRATLTGKTHGIRFQGKFEYMQIYSVPIDLPKYRLKNGRTAAAQIEFLATHSKVDQKIFTNDPELLEAQEIQHSILKGMVNEEGLLDYFKKHEQELPLILTNTGFIVNGNCRVCAMRELYESEQKDYERFKNIDVIILPPCSEEEIDWLEGKEQIHQDITADYSWVTPAVMYRTRMTEHDHKSTYVATLYEVSKTEVDQMLDMLSHAEAYLKDRGKEGQYSLVKDHEYAFRQLRKFRPQLNNEAKKEVYDQLAYTIIDKPEGDRTYKAVADAAKYFDQVIQSILTEFQIKPQSGPQAKARLLGGAKVTLAADVLDVLKTPAQRDKVRDVLREVIASENEKTREKTKANFLLTQVKKAKAALDDAVEAIADDSSRQGIDVLLNDIEEATKQLRKWLLNAKTQD